MNSRFMTRAAMPVVLAAVGLVGARGAAAQRGMVTIPSDTVVHVKLDDRLSSKTARVGDTFAAALSDEDRSGFPVGTRFQGQVTEVQHFSKDKPGLLDVEFRRAYLPDGGKATVNGKLASLADEDVRRTSDGRLESRRGGGGSKPDWKWAGYGAGAGAVLSTIFGGNLLKGALLGGVGGAIYGYLNKDKGKDKNFRDVDLPRGTEFGMLMQRQVAFNDNGSYRYTARNNRIDNPDNDRVAEDRVDDRNDRRADDRVIRRDDERVLGDRQEGGLSTATVRVNGQAVEFTDRKPREIDGVQYFPLATIAQAAKMRFINRRGEQNFVLDTRDGLVDGRAGDNKVYMGDEVITLTDKPMLMSGGIYVTREFFEKVAGMRVDWDRTNMELDLDSNRDTDR